MSRLSVQTEFAEDGVVSVSKAAEMLDKSPRTVKRWCNKGVFRWMKHRDGTRGIDRNDLMSYLRKNEQ